MRTDEYHRIREVIQNTMLSDHQLYKMLLKQESPKMQDIIGNYVTDAGGILKKNILEGLEKALSVEIIKNG
jgi:hypothetical protein